MKITNYIKALIQNFLTESENNSKEYYTTSRPISIKDFIEIEVEERDNYDLSDVDDWIKKYKITENDKLIWVALKPHIAARYEMDSDDSENAEEVYNRNPSDFNVKLIKSDDGFLIPETNDGDGGFIFVFKGKN